MSRKTLRTGEAVEEVSLTLGPGEFVTLLGPSGSGKTTTLQMIAGLRSPSAGEIMLDGQPIGRCRPTGATIGMVFQNYALFPHHDGCGATSPFRCEMRRMPGPRS